MKLLLIILSISYLIISNANAADKKGYIGIEGGFAYVDMTGYANELGQDLANLTGNTVQGSWENSTWAGRAYAGITISPKISLEIGYFYTGDIDLKYTGTYSSTKWSATSANSGKGFDITTKISFGDSLYAKLGIHSSEITETQTLKISTLTFSGKGSKTGVGAVLGLGTRKVLSGNNFWDSSITYYDSLGGHSDANAFLLVIGVGKSF